MFATLTQKRRNHHNPNNTGRKSKGFTLVELVVVLVILVILMAMLLPALTGYIRKAEDAKYIAEGRQVLLATQSVMSAAYADGEKSGYMLSISPSSAPGSLEREIADLAEMKDGTTAQAAYGFSSYGGSDACEVIRLGYFSGNVSVIYYRVLQNGAKSNWSVYRS